MRDEDPVERHRRRAQTALDLARWKLAEREARALLSLCPDDVGGLLQLSQALGGLLRLGEAAEVARCAVALAPEDAFAHYRVGWCLVHLNDPEPAIDPLERAVALEPRSGRYTGFLGYALSEAMRDEGRQSVLARTAVGLSPEDPWTWQFAASTSLGHNDGVAAEHYARGALSLNPLDSEHISTLALALARLGRYDDAEHHAREAIRVYPPGASGWIALAEAHLGRERHDEALAAAKRGCELWSSAWEAWDVLVRVHLACGDRAGAQTAYDDAIATNSRAPRIRRLRALL